MADPATCPRARSDMTSCAVRDGQLALSDDNHCVGCGVYAFIPGLALRMPNKVVNLNTPAPGDRSFVACSCGPDSSTFAVVVIHDAAGAFIAGLVCDGCGAETPIAFGRPS